MSDDIHPGDRVIALNEIGHRISGRAIRRVPYGWWLDAMDPYPTFRFAPDQKIVGFEKDRGDKFARAAVIINGRN